MDNHHYITLVVLALVAVAASFWLGGEYAIRRGLVPAGQPDTVTVTKWVRDTIPTVKDSIIYRTKIVALPVHDTTVTEIETVAHDTVLVEVPIVEKTYTGENYKATVRGFQPELVDIWIKQKETTITVPYRKRWSFVAGPQVGVGYTPSGLQPYAGLGVTFGYSF